MECLLGLDIGGTKCAVVAGTSDGAILERMTLASAAQRGPGPMIDELVAAAQRVMAGHTIGAAGVAIGGPLDSRRGIILSPPNLPGWDEIPLAEILRKRLGVAVHVEHDASACALAEYLWGAGRGLARVVYLTCGTGFGAGMVFDGKIYRGAAGRPSDIGHIRYRQDGPEAYGKRGSLEAFAAGGAIGPIAMWRYPGRMWTQGGLPPEGKMVADLAAGGDEEARDVLAINARAVGHACAMLADLLYPELIVLGSLSLFLGESWLVEVRRAFLEEAHREAGRLCRLAPPGLGERLQDCAALAAAKASSSDSPHGPID